MLVNIVIIAAVLAVAVIGVRRIAQTAAGKRSCCSGGATSQGKKFKPTHITDTNEAHYPYQAVFSIAGMSCENCAHNVENALDSLGDTWAHVDLQKRNAHLFSKQPIDEDACRSVVAKAGYRII